VARLQVQKRDASPFALWQQGNRALDAEQKKKKPCALKRGHGANCTSNTCAQLEFSVSHVQDVWHVPGCLETDAA